LCPTASPTRIARWAPFPNRRSQRTSRRSDERQAVDVGVEIGEYRGVVQVRRPAAGASCRSTLPPSVASKATISSRPRSSAHRRAKIRQRQLAEDGGLEING